MVMLTHCYVNNAIALLIGEGVDENSYRGYNLYDRSEHLKFSPHFIKPNLIKSGHGS